MLKSNYFLEEIQTVLIGITLYEDNGFVVTNSICLVFSVMIRILCLHK